MNLVHAAIKQNILSLKDRKFLLALSGGVDSMVLANAMLELKIPFSVAHCNYRLRDIESDKDADFIRSFCHANNLTLYLKIHPINKNNTSNIQEIAREIRHEYFKFLMDKHHYTNVILAHHSEDRIESFMLNLSRGSGLKGLSTMHLQNQAILRPLLNTKKSELLEYAKIRGIPWREDSSNSESYYSRNYIRHHILPLFNKLNTSFIDNAKKALNHLEFAENLLKSYREIWEENHIKQTNQGIEILISNSLEDYFLFEYLAEKGFHANTIEDIKKNLEDTGSIFESHSQWKAYIDRGKIILCSKWNGHEKTSEIQIFENERMIFIEDSYIKFQKLELKSLIESIKNNQDNQVYFDFDKLKFPLKIRNWKAGDKMDPLGMNGQMKKIQDILSNRKVSRIQKEKTYVVESNEKIIWLVNHCISESVKVTANTDFIYSMNYSNLSL